MAEATRLTRAGKLGEATALIQHLVQGGGAAEPARTGSSTIIDAEPVAADAAARQPARPAASSGGGSARSEEHTSELQSLMRNSYAVFCLKKKKETLQ